MPLAAEDQETLRGEIVRAAGLNPDQGDILRFESGPLGERLRPGTIAPQAQSDEPPPLSPIAKRARDPLFGSLLASVWLWLALAALAVTAVVLLRGRARMSKDEQQTFAELLSENIAMHPEASDGR
jgi:hypothetical protein